MVNGIFLHRQDKLSPAQCLMKHQAVSEGASAAPAGSLVLWLHCGQGNWMLVFPPKTWPTAVSLCGLT